MLRKFIFLSCMILLGTASQPVFGQLLSDLSAFSRLNASQSHLVGMGGLEKGISTHQSILLVAGLDVFNARDIGVKDVEQGWATMAGLGVRHYFNDRRSGLFLEADANLFFRTYRWRDNIGFANEKKGVSSTVTLFPNLNVGYGFEGLNFWDFSPIIGLGYETHLKVSGQDVADGLMPFIGLQVGYWFR